MPLLPIAAVLSAHALDLLHLHHAAGACRQRHPPAPRPCRSAVRAVAGAPQLEAYAMNDTQATTRDYLPSVLAGLLFIALLPSSGRS